MEWNEGWLVKHILKLSRGTVANFWRGMLCLLFCKYRDENLRPGSHPALLAWVEAISKIAISTKLETQCSRG